MSGAKIDFSTSTPCLERLPENGSAPPAERAVLESLVRPLFFPGQLLTDQDLMTFLEWARQKLRRSRHRHGWGVVCGLEVTSHPDPKKEGHIIVQPGYALGPAGEDVVVPRSTVLDLAAACSSSEFAVRTSEGADDPPATLDFAGYHLPTEEVRVADLSISYLEALIEPQAPLRRQPCATRVECEYSRTLEQFALHHQPAEFDRSPLDQAVERWCQEFRATTGVVAEFCDRFPPAGSATAEEIREWLISHVTPKDPQLCWLDEWIHTLGDEELMKEPVQVELLFWLVQNARLSFLGSGCHAASGDAVPLARVWMRVAGTGGEILFIDGRPPYRRPLMLDHWPAPLGRVNLGQLLWRRWDEACGRLLDLGVKVSRLEEVRLPETLPGLATLLEETEIFAGCDEEVDSLVAQVLVSDKPLGRRLVGFAPVARGFVLTKTADKEKAAPGETVNYTFTAENTGRSELIIQILDDCCGLITPEPLPLEPGTSKAFTCPFEVPADAQAELVNRVAAVRWRADRPVVIASVEHRLRIEKPVVPQPDLDLRKEAAQPDAYPWEKVTITYNAHNTGELPLRVEVVNGPEEKKPETITAKGGIEIGPGDTWGTARPEEVPGDARGTWEKPAQATGKTADGGELTARAEFSIKIKQPDDFVLIGMMQPKGQGNLTDGVPAYKAQLHTFAEFADARPERLMKAYEWALQHLADRGRALAEEWQGLARQLAATDLHDAGDVAARSEEELKQLVPGLSERRIRIWRKRAVKHAAKEEVDWEEEAEDAQETGKKTDKKTEKKPEPKPTEKTPSEPTSADFRVLDDMTQTGPKKLRDAGIRTYADLASYPFVGLKKLFPRSSPKRLQRWQEQAAELARQQAGE